MKMVFMLLSEICLLTTVGNHEYFSKDVDNWLKKLPEFNVRPLVNERVCLFSEDTSCAGGVYLAGIEDYVTTNLRLVTTWETML